ncbi:MAG: adenylate/guanylate cyclase domain-containing protein [Treponema sp.]|nr:adenylate/guanylate cyclase domain-containing protein [Treponema sp.]
MVTVKKIGKKLTTVIIISLVFLAITGLHLLGVFQFLENKSYDFRVRFWADSFWLEPFWPDSFYRSPSNDIVVILLEQDSLDWAQLERGWGWPWPRQAYADIVNYMNLSGASSVAFDVIFSEQSIYRNAKQDEIIDNAVNALEEVAQDTGSRSQPGFDPDNRELTSSIENLYGFARQIDSSQLTGTGRSFQSLSGGQQRTGMTSMFSVYNVIINALRSLSSREDDESFIRASADFGHVVQTVMFSSQTGNTLSWPSGVDKPLFRTDNFDSILANFSVGEGEKAQFPIRGLINSAGALGSVTGVPDSDGIIRRLKPFTLFDGRALPGLSAASLIVSGYGTQISYNSKTGTIEWEGISIPVDANGNALLRYRGDFQEKYHPYRVMDILLSIEANERGDNLEFGNYTTATGTNWWMLTPENFSKANVFFGFYAQGLYDIFSTPISSVYPGMGCHITMLDNMLKGDFIRESSEAVNLIILFAVIVLVVCLTISSSRIALSVGGTIFLVVLILVSAFMSYQLGGLWIPMITFIAGTIAGFITVTIYNYATEGSQKRFIKSAFSQYLSPKVIDRIIADPSQLKLGGEKREMTAIFTDIRAFSTFSEALGDPAKLVELLNFYLTKMSNIILNHQGTIDKYEGDAIIAFFGAPVQMDNHASMACRAVVNMKKAEKEINREALSLGLVTPEVMKAMAAKKAIKSIDDPHPIFTRLGINTGDMVVGNMGTPNKMDYTIMGNAVNLAARLEGVNKQYDTGGMLMSEYTRTVIGDEFVVRPLSKVRVVGINTPLRLYELLDIASEASPELLDMVKSWEQAFQFYEEKNFIAAQNIFQLIYSRNSDDMAAKKYLNRCSTLISSPFDEGNWDNGVDNLTEK